MIHSTESLKCINIASLTQIEDFLKYVNISHFLEGDIIIKQGFTNDYLYFIIEGLAEVFVENTDFVFYDFYSVSKFISRPKDSENKSEEVKEHLECQINIETINQGRPKQKEERLNEDSFSYLIKAKEGNIRIKAYFIKTNQFF